MTRMRVRQYQTALEHSRVLDPDGPFRLIDMQRLTEGAPHVPACRYALDRNMVAIEQVRYGGRE